MTGRSRFLVALVVVAVVAALLGCDTTPLTTSRLQQAVGATYQRLYQLQQSELGHADARTDATATCHRTDSNARSGAGTWTCTVHYPYPDGHIEGLALDVEVRAVGCYSAAGPPAVIGAQRITTNTGRRVTNPLFAFDGCLRIP